jgi:uncharacterized protein
MATTLYEATAGRFEQTLTATAAFLEKGRVHFTENGMSLDDLVEARLYPDMLPFRFQVVSAAHHSAGALDAVKTGEFRPPPNSDGMDYSALEARVAEALEKVRTADVDALLGAENNDLVFKLGDREMPFLAGEFLLSFSIPNFFFHATTTYDLLRTHGVPVGKRDFIGRMQMKK